MFTRLLIFISKQLCVKTLDLEYRHMSTKEKQFLHLALPFARHFAFLSEKKNVTLSCLEVITLDVTIGYTLYNGSFLKLKRKIYCWLICNTFTTSYIQLITMIILCP